MGVEFRREYLLQLPLPLAQLYARAYNAKDARSRHDNTYYLFEVWLKLLVAVLLSTYVRQENLSGKNKDIQEALTLLTLPSLGDWVKIMRLLAANLEQTSSDSSHPLGHLWGQLSKAQRSDGIVSLYRRIKRGPDGTPGGDITCTILELIEALVQYRNIVFGHGAQRPETFYGKDMWPLLFAAANDLLADTCVDILGPKGSRMVFLTDLRQVPGGHVDISLRDLIGLQSERSTTIQLQRKECNELDPELVAVIWPGCSVPLRLDPFVIFREGDISDEMLFMNRDRKGKQVEYLSYTTGRTDRDPDMACSLAKFLSLALNQPVTLPTNSEEGSPTDDVATSDNRIIYDYELLSEIGRGGMGIVYLARQLSLDRLVALKMLPSDMNENEIAKQRFRREIRALAECDHPNIIKVLQSGTMPDGHLYYAMEYVSGCDLEQVWQELAREQGTATCIPGQTTFNQATLAASRSRYKKLQNSGTGLHTDRFSRGSQQNSGKAGKSSSPKNSENLALAQDDLNLPPLPEAPDIDDDASGFVKRVCTIIRDTAAALQVVHEHGLVHRDIKPSNILLTSDLNRVVLMDFGLAKSSQPSMVLSEVGGLIGTLRYAAPEQLAAKSIAVGPAADVRGLGVTMWELLTRRRLFAEAEDECRLAALIQEEDVPRLTTIDPSFDRDIEAIVSRATERRVTDRISSAGKLAEYLQLYLEGKPLPIRPPTAQEMLGRWIRKHKALVWSAACVSIIAFLSVITAFLLVLRSRNDALAAKLDAERQREAALTTLVGMVTTAREELQYVSGSNRIQEELVDIAVTGLKAATTGSTPTTRERVRDLAALHLRLSQMMRFSAKWRNESKRHLDIARELAETMQQKHPDDKTLLLLVAEISGSVGDVSHFDKDYSLAKIYYKKQLSLLEPIVNDPDQEEYFEGLIQTHSAYRRLSRLALAVMDPPEAIGWAEKAVGLAQKLAALRPTDPGISRMLALSYISLGDVALAQKNREGGVDLFSRALELIDKLVFEQPGNRHLQRDRGSVLSRLGAAAVAAGESEKALEYYNMALEIREKAARADPDSSFAHRNIAYTVSKIGEVYEVAGDYRQAIKHLDRAESILKKWTDGNDTSGRIQAIQDEVSKRLQHCRKAQSGSTQ